MFFIGLALHINININIKQYIKFTLITIQISTNHIIGYLIWLMNQIKLKNLKILISLLNSILFIYYPINIRNHSTSIFKDKSHWCLNWSTYIMDGIMITCKHWLKGKPTYTLHVHCCFKKLIVLNYIKRLWNMLIDNKYINY